MANLSFFIALALALIGVLVGIIAHRSRSVPFHSAFIITVTFPVLIVAMFTAIMREIFMVVADAIAAPAIRIIDWAEDPRRFSALAALLAFLPATLLLLIVEGIALIGTLFGSINSAILRVTDLIPVPTSEAN